ncbi:MAG TPA: molybdopterin-dependent oxidoreductase, partial [Anaerolineaceae bacterium]
RYAYGEEINALRGLQPGGESGAAADIAAAENLVVFFGSEGLGLAGTEALAEACAALLVSTNHTGNPNNGLVGVWPKANLQGAYDLGFTPAADLPGTLSKASALYIAAADPAGDSPALAKAVEAAGFVVVQEFFLTPTAKLADVVLPAQTFIEREGTFTSGERRVQRFYHAVAPFNGPRPDFRITADVARQLGLDVEGRAASLVFQRLAAETPDYHDLSYPALAQVHAQWPLISRHDLYYGGTGYENREGLGVQLQPQMGDSPRMPAASEPRPAPAEGEIWVAPTTCLYDRGTTMVSNPLLGAHMAGPEIWLSPATAAALQVAQNDMVSLSLDGNAVSVQVKIVETLTDAVGLVPRSVGVPLSALQVVKIQRTAESIAR